jgi:hypothetical protein
MNIPDYLRPEFDDLVSYMVRYLRERGLMK